MQNKSSTKINMGIYTKLGDNDEIFIFFEKIKGSITHFNPFKNLKSNKKKHFICLKDKFSLFKWDRCLTC